MPTWPGTLPQKPLKSSYSRSSKALLIRSPMDAGPAKVRRRTTAGTQPFSVAYRMTSAQKATFEAWVSSDLGDGAMTFDLPNPEATSGTILVRMTGGAGTPLYDIASGPPDMWIVSFAAEVMPT